MNNKHKQCSKFSCETKLQEEQMIHKLHKKMGEKYIERLDYDEKY